MATQGNEKLGEGTALMGDTRVAVVKTAWNHRITDALEAGCLKVLREKGAEPVCETVPGAVELTFAAARLAEMPGIDAVVVLGCVIKGDTPHFDYVCQSVTQGITLLNATKPVPVIFGVLTVLQEAQAWERVGGVHGHKGEEAALTALQMVAAHSRWKKENS